MLGRRTSGQGDHPGLTDPLSKGKPGANFGTRCKVL